MKNYQKYETYSKPAWAPPAWLFAPVWTVLYVIIAVTYGYTGYLFLRGGVPGTVVVLLLMNLVFNLAFTPLQFKLHNLTLATVDVILTFLTLLAALVILYPYAPLVAFANIPYLLWTAFASVLEVSIFMLNKGKAR